jgi:hypothetical protein
VKWFYFCERQRAPSPRWASKGQCAPYSRACRHNSPPSKAPHRYSVPQSQAAEQPFKPPAPPRKHCQRPQLVKGKSPQGSRVSVQIELGAWVFKFIVVYVCLMRETSLFLNIHIPESMSQRKSRRSLRARLAELLYHCSQKVSYFIIVRRRKIFDVRRVEIYVSKLAENTRVCAVLICAAFEL